MSLVKIDEINKIEKMINTLRRNDTSIDLVLSIFEKKGHIILIGGAIRSILQEDYKLRDVDLILKLSIECDIDTILNSININYKKNRFGGYKIFFNKITFDLWTIENHWSFKSSFYEEKIENIEKTTLLNYDSLVYDYYSKKLYKTYYEKCVQERLIDIIGTEDYVKENPCPDINTLRILKIKMETGYNLSIRSCKYIKKYYESLDKYTDIYSELKKAYIRHYGYNIDNKLDGYIYEFLSKFEKYTELYS